MFRENSQWLKTFFVKHSILDIWQGSKYESVICYPLFGKIEDSNKAKMIET